MREPLLQLPNMACPVCFERISGIVVSGKVVFFHSKFEPATCPNAGKKYRLSMPSIEVEVIQDEEVPA